MPRSPIYRQTLGPYDIAGGAQSVNVTTNGKPLRWLKVSPTKDPNSGSVHTLAVNAATPVWDMEGSQTYEVDLLELKDPDFYVHTLILTPGADASSFKVIGHI